MDSLFFNNPLAETMDEIAGTVVDRVLDLAGFKLGSTYRWGE
jgi:3-polyprenyl-4-hydroxybenzoate decarboxylase